MGWLIAGLIVGGAYGALWAWMFLAGDDDDVSMREYERQRAEFERWFE